MSYGENLEKFDTFLCKIKGYLILVCPSFDIWNDYKSFKIPWEKVKHSEYVKILCIKFQKQLRLFLSFINIFQYTRNDMKRKLKKWISGNFVEKWKVHFFQASIFPEWNGFSVKKFICYHIRNNYSYITIFTLNTRKMNSIILVINKIKQFAH